MPRFTPPKMPRVCLYRTDLADIEALLYHHYPHTRGGRLFSNDALANDSWLVFDYADEVRWDDQAGEPLTPYSGYRAAVRRLCADGHLKKAKYLIRVSW